MQAQTELKQKQPTKKNLLIGITGSVAIIKLPQLVVLLAPHFNIKILATKHSFHFLNSQQYKIEFQKHLNAEAPLQIYQDNKQWQMWGKRGDPVLHIQLRKWADAMLIAPLGANTLAKLSNGLCDNLITLVCRAWPMQKDQNANTLIKPIIACPSMNSLMWQHPVTGHQIQILRGWGYEILGPVSKKMMCGDVGNGAMREVQDIAKYMTDRFSINK